MKSKSLEISRKILNPNVPPQLRWAYGTRILFVLLALYTFLITGWVSDDAQITFRQIWNFLNGDGITFNFEERVQAFTHPLWFMLLSYVVLFTDELFTTTILLSVFLSLLAILALFRIEILNSKDKLTIISPIYALVLSWAFCDYATSGLENPLSFLLIGILLNLLSAQEFRRYLKHIYVILALLVLNRFDYSILFLPLSLILLIDTKKMEGLWKTIFPGVIILCSWLIFATFYFGSPLPNTFYAKLSTGYPFEEVLANGIRYFTSLRTDLVSLAIIIVGFILSIACLNRFLIAIAVGQLFYYIFILTAGGDFMQGRFFAVPVYLSMGQIIFALAHSRKLQEVISYKSVLIFMLIILHIGAIKGFPFSSGTDYSERKRVKDILDERGIYYKDFGLFSHSRDSWPNVMIQDVSPKKFGSSCGLVGNHALKEVNVHLIDYCALTDPFLSKIPAIQSINWRIGHSTRKIPEGYGEFLIGNADGPTDKKLSDLFHDINLITRENLFSLKRFSAIYRLNTNFYSNVDFKKYMDSSVFVPLTNIIETININDWNEHIDPKHFNSNLRIISRKSIVAGGIRILTGSKFSYDIFVNGKKVGETTKSRKFINENIIFFDSPMHVVSIMIKATDQLYSYPLGTEEESLLVNYMFLPLKPPEWLIPFLP